jgi:hypothetical protein
MQTIIKTLIYLTVLAELLLSSCASTKNLYGEYDDIYYSPVDKEIAQNNEIAALTQNQIQKVDTSIVLKRDSSLNYNSPLVFTKYTGKEIRNKKKTGQLPKPLLRQYRSNGFFIYQDNKILNNTVAFSILKTNEESTKMLETADAYENKWIKTNSFMDNFTFSWLIISSIANLTVLKETGWYALPFPPLIIAIPVAIRSGNLRTKYINSLKEAINLYNGGLKASFYLPNPTLRFGFTPNGFGMRMNF